MTNAGTYHYHLYGVPTIFATSDDAWQYLKECHKLNLFTTDNRPTHIRVCNADCYGIQPWLDGIHQGITHRIANYRDHFAQFTMGEDIVNAFRDLHKEYLDTIQGLDRVRWEATQLEGVQPHHRATIQEWMNKVQLHTDRLWDHLQDFSWIDNQLEWHTQAKILGQLDPLTTGPYLKY